MLYAAEFFGTSEAPAPTQENSRTTELHRDLLQELLLTKTLKGMLNPSDKDLFGALVQIWT